MSSSGTDLLSEKPRSYRATFEVLPDTEDPPESKEPVTPPTKCGRFLEILKDIFIQLEVAKAVLAFMYLVTVSFCLSCLMVVAHLRMPNNITYHGEVRALPDLILDWLPARHWAFVLSEILINVMAWVCLALIIFHAHSLVVVRRFFTILGTVYLLRGVCTVVTSLPPPTLPYLPKGCQPLVIPSAGAFFAKAARIFIGMGMKIQGGETCGDFIFSGHTATLTTLNLIFLTYAPCNIFFIPLKVLTCIAHVVGMVAILLSHEHYTVDIVLGLFIAYLFFMEYHFVARYLQLTGEEKPQPLLEESPPSAFPFTANSRWTWKPRYMRIRFLAPLTYLMEHNGDGMVENRLRIPFLHYCFPNKRW